MKIKESNIIGVITPYKRQFEFWKQDIGFNKYGKDATFIMLDRVEFLYGVLFKAIELGYMHTEVDSKVYDLAMTRLIPCP